MVATEVTATYANAASPLQAGRARTKARKQISTTALAGTSLPLSLDHRRQPGTAPSRENAKSMREADVTADIPQNSWPPTAMASRISAHVLESAWSSTVVAANVPASATSLRSVIANVNARIRTYPAMAETSTEFTTPLAAVREASWVSSERCAEAS